MAVAENTPTASFLTKIGKMQSAGCRLCTIAREARGESTDGLADETHGHIKSAGCEGMATTVTAAHHSIWRHPVYDSVYAAQKPKSKLKFITLGKGSEHAVATKRVSKNLQQGRAGGEGTGYRGDNTCHKNSRDMVQPRSRIFLRKWFLGQATGRGRDQ